MNNCEIDHDQLMRYGNLYTTGPSTKIEPTNEIDMIWQDLNEGMRDKALEKLVAIIESLQERLDKLESNQCK